MLLLFLVKKYLYHHNKYFFLNFTLFILQVQIIPTSTDSGRTRPERGPPNNKEDQKELKCDSIWITIWSRRCCVQHNKQPQMTCTAGVVREGVKEILPFQTCLAVVFSCSTPVTSSSLGVFLLFSFFILLFLPAGSDR